jgi:hypothetical protein
MKCCATLQLNDHLLVNTPTLTKSASISAKPAAPNFSAVKPSFTLDAAGHRSTLQLQMMLLSSLKIDHYFHVLELKCDVLHAVHT